MTPSRNIRLLLASAGYRYSVIGNTWLAWHWRHGPARFSPGLSGGSGKLAAAGIALSERCSSATGATAANGTPATAPNGGALQSIPTGGVSIRRAGAVGRGRACAVSFQWESGIIAG